MSTANRVWINVSDMMTGLMMIFLFLSVVYMQHIGTERKAIEQIAITHQKYREELTYSLLEEFKKDLTIWNAEILGDSTVRFKEPDVLFDQGSIVIKPKFAEILDDFFPRYVALLASDKYQPYVDELRIEGHTSSSWENSRDLQERYLKNAQLSQSRSFAILQYCFGLKTIEPYREWLTQVLRANGLAFAKPVLSNGQEDQARSRRVEFKVTTKAEDKIHEIIQTIDQAAQVR